MRRVFLLLVVVFVAFSVRAQERSISGKITDDSGESVPGANVLLKGTNNGTVTDVDGNFKMTVPNDNAVLVISFIGLKTVEVEVGARSVIDVQMQADVEQLSEVVVTALGVSREKSSLGYSVQEVGGDQLNMVNENNVVSSLTGKVAGVQVIGTSGANLGGSTKIRLRGITSLGESSPLFVVDGTPISNDAFGPTGRTHYSGARDYGNLASDINPNDIESVSVLKGPSAAALYGQRGANGVILITTKKGSKKSGIGVDISHSTTFDRVYVLPEYQDEYAGGYTQDISTFSYDPAQHPASWASFDGHNVLNYAADESWGPRIDGTPVRHWDSWFPGDEFGQLRPLEANPDNVKDFFETGLSVNNNISLTGGGDKSTFRLSIGALNQGGVLPNSELEKYTAGFNGSLELSEKLTASASINYANTQGKGRPALGYGTGPVSSMNQWFQRQLDMDRLKDYTNADGTQRFWNIRNSHIAAGETPSQPQYWNNPYWDLFENVATDNRDRIYGNVALSYQLMDNLKVTGFLRNDQYTLRIEEIEASGGLNLDSYSYSLVNGRENNYEMLVEHQLKFGDFSLNSNLGGNIRKNYYTRSDQETNGGLSVAGYYDIAASIDRPTNDTRRTEKEVRSFYLSTSLGYKDFLYLDLTGRQDWSSSLPANNNGYFYPSASLSLVFSELVDADFLSFGKIRASAAQVGSDVDPYNIFTTYSVGNPYGGNAVLTVNDKLFNQDLRPQLSNNVEIGADLRFLQNRIGVDFTYYKNNVEDQILELTVPGASGYSTAIVNAGEIESSGVELMLTGSPVKNANFNWDVNLNFARNRSQVISLSEGLDNRELQLALSDRWGGLRVNARVGEDMFSLTGGGFATFQAEDAEGNPIDHENNGMRIVDEDGYYQYEANKDLGTLLPDFTGGLRNTFSYKNLSLSVFIDFQKGGKFHSITRMFNAYSGLGAETVGNNDLGNPVRDPIADGGGIRVDGVDANGNASTHYVEAQSYYSNLFGINENWLYDASYIKLRELRLGYNLPSSLISKTPFNKISVAVIGKNLWLMHSEVDGIDPSEIGEGAAGFSAVEGGVLPGVRSIGFNVNLGL